MVSASLVPVLRWPLDRVQRLIPSTWSYHGFRDWTNRAAGNGVHRAVCWIIAGFAVATSLYAATDGSSDFYELAMRSAFASGLLSAFYLAGLAINAIFPDHQNEDHQFVWNVAEFFTAGVLKLPILYAAVWLVVERLG